MKKYGFTFVLLLSLSPLTVNAAETISFWCALSDQKTEMMALDNMTIVMPPQSFKIAIEASSFWGSRTMKIFLQPGELLNHLGRSPRIEMPAYASPLKEEGKLSTGVNEWYDRYMPNVLNHNDGWVSLRFKKYFDVFAGSNSDDLFPNEFSVEFNYFDHKNINGALQSFGFYTCTRE